MTFAALSPAERDALREGLETRGRAHHPGLLSAPDCARLRNDMRAAEASGASGREFDLLDWADAGLASAVDAFWADLGLQRAGGRSAGLRHGSAQFGLPELKNGPVAFVLDLNDAWRATDGGLLLFAEGEERVQGWRPEAGALTLFDVATPPLLTVVAPAARQPRLAVVGWL